MRKLLAMVATIAAVLCSSTSYAGVVVSSSGVTTSSSGRINSATVTTNALTSGGNLVTDATNTIPSSGAFGSFISTLSGPFDVFLITSTTATPSFNVNFSDAVLGIVATNLFTNTSTLMPRDLMAEFDATLLANGLSVSGLAGNNNLALEVIGLNFANPDVLNVSGSTVTGVSGFSGPDSFFVLVAVPEPSSLAIWGLCSVGAVVAARRRLRKKIA
jgi:hypothetical protein